MAIIQHPKIRVLNKRENGVRILHRIKGGHYIHLVRTHFVPKVTWSEMLLGYKNKRRTSPRGVPS